MTANEIARIQARSGCAPGTVRKFIRGESVREASRLRILAAMKAEGIVLVGKVEPQGVVTLGERP